MKHKYNKLDSQSEYMTEFKWNGFFNSFEVLSIVLKFRSKHPILTSLFHSNKFGSWLGIFEQFEYRAVVERELEIVRHFELKQLPILRRLNFSCFVFFVLRFFDLEGLEDVKELVGEMSASVKPKNWGRFRFRPSFCDAVSDTSDNSGCS